MGVWDKIKDIMTIPDDDELENEAEGELFSDDESRLALVKKVIFTRMLPLLVIFLCCVLPNFVRAIDGELYIFARALGNAGALSHTYYDDAMWIVISDTTHAGRLYYEFFKFEGGDDLVDRMSLLAENYYEDQEGVYTFNDESITEEEFNTLHDEIFGK